MWLRIKGYNDQPDRVALATTPQCGRARRRNADGPVFCGDAIADPLTAWKRRGQWRSRCTAAAGVDRAVAGSGGRNLCRAAARIVGIQHTDRAPQPPPRAPRATAGADNAAVRHIVAERLCASC
ncbi:hypothetical protein I553_2775 [Mycobacterium xenopi 4042]|uniref:Uncharacterized protein n=1 Tax=Mycobacterium xenopi 4042 TaxID=1299334 RepID=X8BKW6_MYCXE|nr:hypothetical protein I553_2775 [Mycobacterium xenopi 4042]